MASQLEPEEGLSVGSWQHRSLMGQLCVLSATIAPRFPHPLHSGERNTRSETGIAPAFPFSTSDMAPQAAELSLVAKISASIWQNEAICQEEKYLKKRWFVRNGQDTDKVAGWEKPVMVVMVQNVWFGPVIQVAVTPFH